jgi:hypothetical protein
MSTNFKIQPMYPGIYGANEEQDGGERLQTAPLNTLLGFDLETYQIPLDQICFLVKRCLMGSWELENTVRSFRLSKR